MSEPDQSRRTTRLAPSPTGALHLGNACTFLATWAIARNQGWRIYLRIEDLDTPRVKADSAARIAETLRFLGIDWDEWEGPGGPVLTQSVDLSPYRKAMQRLAAMGCAYPCALTRQQSESAASAPQEGAHEVAYPASLRPPEAGMAFDFDAHASSGAETNWRLVMPEGAIEFEDRVQGPQSLSPAASIGDFILWTKRGQPSYQLAVVVDDHRQGVTDVIRGSDLLDSAARQLVLYRLLGLGPEPVYWHLPLIVGPDGKRLAKRHGDTRVDHYRSRGVPREAFVGLFAYWLGLKPTRERLGVADFRAALRAATIPRGPITFTVEDDQWLGRQAQG